MESRAPEEATSARVVTQARVFEAVIGSGVVSGTLVELTRQLGVAAGDLLDGLDELVRVGWVALDVDPERRFTIRLAD
jgi:hypothetical protein